MCTYINRKGNKRNVLAMVFHLGPLQVNILPGAQLTYGRANHLQLYLTLSLNMYMDVYFLLTSFRIYW